LLRDNPAFRRLWLSRFVSMVGDSLALVAQSKSRERSRRQRCVRVRARVGRAPVLAQSELTDGLPVHQSSSRHGAGDLFWLGRRLSHKAGKNSLSHGRWEEFAEMRLILTSHPSHDRLSCSDEDCYPTDN